MNKEQLEGYLLACCDVIDRMIETSKLKEDDLAGKLSENLREYIGINQLPHFTWTNASEYSINLGSGTPNLCKYCGKQMRLGEIHTCNNVSYFSDGTK